jgi:hypothetical protein
MIPTRARASRRPWSIAGVDFMEPDTKREPPKLAVLRCEVQVGTALGTTKHRMTTHGYEPTGDAAMAAFAKSWRRE